MKITLESIKKLNPCRDRLDNYVKHYGEREFTPRQFMGLKNITHQDKLWVAFRVLDRKQVTLAAADIAESVLSVYEAKYPNDKRPREYIESTRLYANGKITIDQAIEKRSAATSNTDAAVASTYAYAAHAAANNATYAYTAHAAANNATHAADVASSYDATAGSTARAAQEKRCRTIILKYLKG